MQLVAAKEEGADEETTKIGQNAQRLLDVLSDHHKLLATLLLANAAAMEALPIFLDVLVPSWLAIVLSVSLVLIFGEVIPQAVCTGPSQIAIAVKMICIVKFMMFVLYPICKPIGLILDCVLGHHGTKRYTKKNLKELIRLHEITKAKGDGDDENAEPDQLTHEEVGILLSTIDLRHMNVCDKSVFIRNENVYMIDENRVIDKKLIAEIVSKGYTRFPVCQAGYDGRIGYGIRLRGILGVKRMLAVKKDGSATIKQAIDRTDMDYTPTTYVAKIPTCLHCSEFSKRLRHLY
jgi:metal transporter CNNM